YLTLLINHMDFAACTIGRFYNDRWQIELFFKAINQNLKIKTFVGTSEYDEGDAIAVDSSGNVFVAGSSGATLLAATTKTRFSAARTGTCSAASSRANEFRLLHKIWAPRRASPRGVSLITPSIQAYMPIRPIGVSTTGPGLWAGCRTSFSGPISTCLSLVATRSPAGP
ncbi:MAG: hypothetical protein HGA45_23550, partial [Chloroflexales bacterium]|nr:hypothetical protein [Chloroflexales bacterium]